MGVSNVSVMYSVLAPFTNELPSSFSNRLGAFYANSSSNEEKKNKGQFFSPLQIAFFMASLSTPYKSNISILDPGCGTGILSVCLIESLLSRNSGLTSIYLDAYETDELLIKFSHQTYSYLKEWLECKNIHFEYNLHVSDFVIDNSKALDAFSDLFSTPLKKFDYIISNPPYFKLGKDDEKTKAAKNVVNGHANIYSIFMAISAQLLNSDGELIFITPRSFSSGNYFHVFRNSFFGVVDLIQAHLFHSRKDTFSKDNVLQETVIMKCKPKLPEGRREAILVTSSNGIRDLQNTDSIVLPSDLVIEYNSKEKMVYLPTSKKEKSIVELFRTWKGNLNKYNIQISTGPVVAHRSWDFVIQEITQEEDTSIAPLFWLHNVSKMKLLWPINKKNKGQYIHIEQKSLPILIENKNYLFLRRFSSKDDKSRLIAAPYFSNTTKSTHIGVENKLNYIYRPMGLLERSEIIGLGALLNSELFDQFFRIINGNVNVSATELRLMPLPPHETIKEIGNELIHLETFDNLSINSIITNRFGLKTLSGANE